MSKRRLPAPLAMLAVVIALASNAKAQDDTCSKPVAGRSQEEMQRCLMGTTGSGEAGSGPLTKGPITKGPLIKGPDAADYAEPTPAAPRALAVPIQFDKDSDQLRSDVRADLATLAGVLNANPLLGEKLMIAGHTDQSGGATYNIDLSLRRADRVRQFLASRGVDASRMQTEGKGFSELLPGHPASSPIHRRVVVSIR